MHSLLDNRALTKAQALESAYEVREESIAEGNEPGSVARRSLKLLDDMKLSIEAHSKPSYASPGTLRG